MKKIYLPLLLLLTCALRAQTPIQEIANNLKSFSELPQEKTYLSFDKPYYAPDETAFFKAFVVNARTHEAAALSAILHVDIYQSESKNRVTALKLPIENGVSNGSIVWSYGTGSFLVHAYTQWMLNAPTDFHFQKIITVSNTPSVAEATNAPPPIVSAQAQLNLQFFPEGGQCVEGLPCRMAFKATDGSGFGVNVMGSISDKEGAGVAIFKDEHLGMGSFGYTPVAGKQYTAFVELPDGTKLPFALPAAAKSGYVLSADAWRDSAFIKVSIRTNVSDNKLPNALYILAHTRGTLNTVNEIILKNKNEKAFQITLPKTQFERDGIATITLFDDKGTPLCERLVFIDNKKDRVNIKVNTDKNSYKKREKVALTIETTDANGKPIPAELSLRVFNDERVKLTPNSDNLLSYMLLSSDVKGYVENPAYYFTDVKLAKRFLDNLLMTQGWRRFTWQQVADTAAVPKVLPEFSLSVSGQVTDGKKSLKNQNLLVSIFDVEENGQSLYTQSDISGNFTLPAYFTDTTRVYVNALGLDKPIDFKLFNNNTESVAMPTLNTLPDKVKESLDKYLAAAREEMVAAKQRAEKQIVLEEVTVKAKRETKRDSRTYFYNFPDRSTKMDAAREGLYTNALDFLLMSGLVRYKTNYSGRIEFQPLRGQSSFSGQAQPLVMLDGLVVDAEALRAVPAKDVDRIDVVAGARTSALLGSRGAGGAINVLTKINDTEKKTNKPITEPTGQRFETIMGYSLVKQFYTPDYSERKPEHDILDKRNTVYWSPSVRTDESGKTTIIFYTTDDNNAIFRILTEGYHSSGKLGVAVGNFKND